MGRLLERMPFCPLLYCPRCEVEKRGCKVSWQESHLIRRTLSGMCADPIIVLPTFKTVSSGLQYIPGTRTHIIHFKLQLHTSSGVMLMVW